MNDELKPCPFCGGEAVMTEEVQNAKYYSRVVCHNCGAKTERVEISLEYCAEEKATELWNNRVEDKSKDIAIANLKNALKDICCDAERIVDVYSERGKTDVAEVRHSHWIEQCHMTDIRSTYFMCADCKRIVEMPHGNDIKKYAPYCNCGAKMDGDPDESKL